MQKLKKWMLVTVTVNSRTELGGCNCLRLRLRLYASNPEAAPLTLVKKSLIKT